MSQPTMYIGFPKDKPAPEYDLIYAGTTQLPDYKHTAIYSMSDHPSNKKK